ncbi:hypothetical protein C0989_000427 [Termitomyces sp. Mn162]|nr:hypothetical protein C0989_000427 [Termitomyces sp. Mn162]
MNLITTQTLTTKDGTRDSPRTAYQCLCKALSFFRKAEIFALFLSTYSKLSEFTRSARNFYRGQDDDMDALNPPFVELPFDLGPEGKGLVTESEHTIEEVCSLKFMARFGRPLFWSMMNYTDDEIVMKGAMEELVLQQDGKNTLTSASRYELHEPNLLPILALRVDLTFESNRDEAVFLEGLLVASSMRTEFSAPEHRQYLRGGYPSEPFLAEAASRVLYNYFATRIDKKFKGRTVSAEERLSAFESLYKEELPRTINFWLSAGLVNKGERGELVAKVLLTVAHDIAVLRRFETHDPKTSEVKPISFSDAIPVIEFLSSLIPPNDLNTVFNARPENDLDGKPLKEAFKNAYVRFTHFARGGDNFVVTDEACLGLFFRAAAIIGHATLAVMDLIIPIWIWDELLSRWSMSGIFVQIKNRLRKQSIHINVENKFGFFSDKNGVPDNRPYITIAMELGVVPPETLPKFASVGRPVDNQPSTSQQICSQKFKTTSQVKVAAPKKLSPHRSVKKRVDKHPRYEIELTGCSPSAYNVVTNKIDYDPLLAYTSFLAEHSRSDELIEAITPASRFKPLDMQFKGTGKPLVDSVQVRHAGDNTQSESEGDDDDD